MEILNNAIARKPTAQISKATFSDLIEILERAENLIAKNYKFEALEVMNLALGIANNLQAHSVKPEIFRAINHTKAL